jgi:hypothetical protein
MNRMLLGGPMFEPAQSRFWKSVHGQDGAHYNVFRVVSDNDGMDALRAFFPTGDEPSDLNFVLFSTSGVHGSYATIESEEADAWRLDLDDDEPATPYQPRVTFLVVSPRICCLRYGNCLPQNADDFAYLKRLRAASWKAIGTVGAPATESEP